MLKRSKAWRRANQQGTVLLTVVIMVMVLFTLTSICLDVIHHSTRMSSKNVQKTQAKLTAEKVLTEFIEGYKRGKLEADSTLKAEAAYNDLKNMAGKDQANAKVIKVSMKDSSGATQSDFDHQFGTTELHIYKTGTGFVVESICTYSTQTQTASCVFEGTSVTPYVPSNTIETQKGKLIGEEQLSNGAKGSVWIQKGGSDNGYKKLSRIGNEAHYYIEHNVRLDDKWTTTDVENHIDPDAVDTTTGDKILKFKVDGFGFKQAPTVTVDGYFTNKNSPNGVFTTVGKIDANMISPTYTGSEGTYDPTNLGNYDGYVKIDKKLIITNCKDFVIGSPASGGKNLDIDLYARGLVCGPFPVGKVTGAHDFEAEANTVKTIYGDLDNYSNGNPGEEFKVYGNVVINKGKDLSTQDGSIALTHNNKLLATGDVLVQGDIYFFGSGCNITCKNFACEGTIYVGTMGSGASLGTGYENINSTVTAYTIGEGGSIPSALSSYITASGTVSNHIDTTKQRNLFPEDGYDPQTGNSSASKIKLQDLYGDASANDIFTTSLDGAEGALKDSSKEIGQKYADAMQRGFIRDPSTGALSSVKTYKGKPVVEFIGRDGGGAAFDSYYRINASVKLSPSQADNASCVGNDLIAYVINLTDEDIVVALPTGRIGAKFRVDTSNRVTNPTNPDKDPFVYFMFYDPNKLAGLPTPDNTDTYDRDCCLYYTGTSKSVPGKSGSGTYAFDGIGVVDGDATSGYGYDSAIWFGNASKDVKGTLVGDMETVDKTSADKYHDDSASDSEKIAALKKNFRETNGFNNSSNMNNTIMYLVPNDVGFAFSTSTYTTDFAGWNGGSSGAWYAQGLIYGVRSCLKINAQEDQGGLYGQIKGYEVKFYGDNKGHTIDCPIEEGSLLGYVKAANSKMSVEKLQYYLY